MIYGLLFIFGLLLGEIPLMKEKFVRKSQKNQRPFKRKMNLVLVR